MKYGMYSIKDELNGFTPVIPMMSDDIAKRYLRDQMEGNPTIKNSPKDFSIWKIGTFDTETGKFTQTKTDIKLIERAENYGENTI